MAGFEKMGEEQPALDQWRRRGGDDDDNPDLGGGIPPEGDDWDPLEQPSGRNDPVAGKWMEPGGGIPPVEKE